MSKKKYYTVYTALTPKEFAMLSHAIDCLYDEQANLRKDEPTATPPSEVLILATKLGTKVNRISRGFH